MNQASSLVEQILSENLNEEQTSEALDVKVATLRNWRSQDKGPDYLKIGRSVKYPIDGIHTFINKQRRKAR